MGWQLSSGFSGRLPPDCVAALHRIGWQESPEYAPKCSKGGTDPLTDGLQRFKPGSLLGRMDTHTLRRIMIHCDKDRHLPVLAGVGRRHIGPPHRIDLRGNDRPIMGFGTMWMALPRGGQQTVGPHEAQHPAW